MMSRKQLLPLLVLLGMLPTLAPSGFAQAPAPPLNFGNNFLVTGDYVVAGAYGMTTKFETRNGTSYAIGTITVPDANAGIQPGVQGEKQVPKGGQVVAALLYWQTVEKVGVAPGAPGSGLNGFFRPLFYSGNGGPAAPGYAIAGTNLSGSTVVSWNSGGCGGGSTGKLLRTYRADVGGALPVDSNGNPMANGSFEVRLPSSGNSTPLTLGATLVIIYRMPGGVGVPSVPLNAIVIYDGDYSQSNAQLTMIQQMQGFYDAAASPVSRLTHIVGSGQSNKFQTVYLGSGNSPVPLPSLYGKQPPFPGSYGTWDNPTWTFSNAGTNPIKEDFSSVTTKVVPSMSNQGCVSWGAVIVSTTVKNSDNDGILNSWKMPKANPPGYCDAAYNNGVCRRGDSTDPTWVPLPDAQTGHKDIFLQYDYMCSDVSGGSCVAGGINFDPRLATDPADHANPTAIDKVVDAFNKHSIVLHAIPGNAISETSAYDSNFHLVPATCSDSDLTCPFPNELGTVGFREGLGYIKNQTIERQTGRIGCDATAHPDTCFAVFPHGKKDSYHYALFSQGVALPSWFLSDQTTLTSVVQSGHTVTFTTPASHGIAPIPGDNTCPNGRVTVIFAISNPSLNGTYCVLPTNPLAKTFAINVGGSANATYTSKTDPNLAVANGQVTSMSGFSDVGGQNSVISLGYGGWGPPTNDGNTWQVKAGTFMHELGHTLGMTHGGTFYNKLGSNDYTPTFEPNCKPNLQSVMNYQFQVDLLVDKGTGHQVVDYSNLALTDLSKSSNQNSGVLSSATYANTAWFQLTDYVHSLNPNIAPSVMSAHCDGSPRLHGDPNMTYVSGPAGNFFSSSAGPNTGLDINYDGHVIGEILHGHDEWDGELVSPGLDLQQVSAVGTVSTVGLGGDAGALKPAGGGGALKPAGGGGALHPAGGGGALKPAGGGGALKPAGGGGLNSDISHEAANAYTRPPSSLTATEAASARVITLNWTQPTFGQIVQYTVYRAIGAGPFQFRANVPAGGPAPFPPATYQDTVACNPAGYSYEVTAFVNNEVTGLQESLPSNVVPATGQDRLTGCYTEPINLVSPTSAFQGTVVPITWTLTDDFYTVGHPVTNKAANTLVAIGPVPGTCAMGQTTILSNGTPTALSGASTFPDPISGQFTFNWDTDGFCAGSYTFKLTLDSTQTQTTAPPLQLHIDINDLDTPHITTLSLPNAVAGSSYSQTLTQEGGVGAVTWSVASGSPPPNILLGLNSGTLSGTPCVPGTYTFTVQVTDSVGNSGTQTFTVPELAAPVAQANQPLAPESAVPGVAGFNLTVNGTGFDTCSAVRWNGSAVATTFNSATQLTAAIPASDVAASGTASISVTKTGSPSSNVDFFQITNPTATVFLSPAGAATGVGLNPIGLIAGDFNGDGTLDLAVANSGTTTVSILLGNGGGTFTAQPALTTGSVPYSLTAGDLNNDGKLDLAVTNFANGAASTVSIFLGNGNGTFQTAVSYNAGSGPISVVTGDFNGDGKLDLAVANQNDHTVSILLGYGDGTFQPAVPYQAGTTDVAAVATGDFNGDGKLDLALTNPSDDTVSVLLGNGDGTFNAAVPYATGNSGDHPIAISAADLNGDGKLDLAVTNLNARTVAILLGNGNGTFQSSVPYPTSTGLLTGPGAMTTGDFNGDGKVDLAITGQINNSVSILLGNAGGTFQSPLEFTTGNLAAGVAAGDFNGDGRLDVAVANTTDGTVSVMLQVPHVNLAPSPLAFGSVTTGTSSSPSVVTLTNDGSAALTISNIAIGGTNPGDFSQNNNCPTSPSTLAAGSSCTINVTFTPGATGARSATLNITDNASDSPQVVNLTGSGS